MDSSLLVLILAGAAILIYASNKSASAAAASPSNSDGSSSGTTPPPVYQVPPNMVTVTTGNPAVTDAAGNPVTTFVSPGFTPGVAVIPTGGTAVTGVRTLAETLTQLQTYVTPDALLNPAQWNDLWFRVTGIVAPDPQFWTSDPKTPINLADFWSQFAPAAHTDLGLSGGLSGLGWHV